MMPYFHMFGNLILFGYNGSRSLMHETEIVSKTDNCQFVPLAVTEYDLRGIIKVPYFIPLHCILTFLKCPIEVGLLLYGE